MTLISGTPLLTWKKLEPVRFDLATATPLQEPLKPMPGGVWCEESFTELLKGSGLAPTGAKAALRSGINLHGFQLTPEQLARAAAMLAEGQTALGPLKELEKTNQLKVPALEIQKQAKQTWEEILKVGEKASDIAERLHAAGKLDRSGEEVVAVLAGLDIVNQLRHSGSKSRLGKTVACTIDVLLILNVITPLIPHGSQYKPALMFVAGALKDAKGICTAFHPPS